MLVELAKLDFKRFLCKDIIETLSRNVISLEEVEIFTNWCHTPCLANHINGREIFYSAISTSDYKLCGCHTKFAFIMQLLQTSHWSLTLRHDRIMM